MRESEGGTEALRCLMWCRIPIGHAKQQRANRKRKAAALNPKASQTFGEGLPAEPEEEGRVLPTFRPNPLFQQWVIRQSLKKLHSKEVYQKYVDVLKDTSLEHTKSSEYAGKHIRH